MLFFSQWRPHFRIALPQLDLTRMVSINVSNAGGKHFPSTKVSLPSSVSFHKCRQRKLSQVLSVLQTEVHFGIWGDFC